MVNLRAISVSALVVVLALSAGFMIGLSAGQLRDERLQLKYFIRGTVCGNYHSFSECFDRYQRIGR